MIIETKQGSIRGQVLKVKPELTEKKCVNFSGIPFATAERFEKAKPFGQWEREQIPQFSKCVETSRHDREG